VHAYEERRGEERRGEGEQVKWGGTRERVVIRLKNVFLPSILLPFVLLSQFLSRHIIHIVPLKYLC
jgi:hypothetical protein